MSATSLRRAHLAAAIASRYIGNNSRQAASRIKFSKIASQNACFCSTAQSNFNTRRRQFSVPSVHDEDITLTRIQEILKDGKVEDAEEFFFQLHQESGANIYAPNKEHVSVIVDAWQKSPHQAEAFLMRLQKLYMENGHEHCQPDREYYDLVLQGWHDFKPPSAKRAQALFDYMMEIGVEYHVDSCNIVLAAWSLTSNAEGGQAHLDQVLKQGHPVSLLSFIYVLEAWSKSKSPLAPQKAEALLLEMKVRKMEPTPRCYLIAMECWARSKKQVAAERSETLLEVIRKLCKLKSDLPILQSAMLNILHVYGRRGNAHKSEEILNEFILNYQKNKRVALTLPMYISVLSTWSKSKSKNRPARAEKLLLRMGKKRGLPKPDVVCYTTVLHCWASSNKDAAAERAEALLKTMNESPHVEPNLLSYTCILHAWSRSKDPTAPLNAERVFQEMLDRNLSPDKLTFGAMITTWGRSSREDAVEKAEAYLQQLKDIYAETGDVKCMPSVVQYTATMQAWANHVKINPNNSREAVSRVESMLDEMLNSEEPQMKPNSLTFASILKTIAGARRIPDRCDRAESILRVMEQEGVELTPFILNIAKKCCPKLNTSKYEEDQEEEDEDRDY